MPKEIQLKSRYARNPVSEFMVSNDFPPLATFYES